MSPQAEQLLQSALGLSESERIELAEALLETTMPSIDPDWLAEIQRRYGEIDRGEVTLRTWAEVKESARGNRVRRAFGPGPASGSKA